LHLFQESKDELPFDPNHDKHVQKARDTPFLIKKSDVPKTAKVIKTAVGNEDQFNKHIKDQEWLIVDSPDSVSFYQDLRIWGHLRLTFYLKKSNQLVKLLLSSVFELFEKYVWHQIISYLTHILGRDKMLMLMIPSRYKNTNTIIGAKKDRNKPIVATACEFTEAPYYERKYANEDYNPDKLTPDLALFNMPVKKPLNDCLPIAINSVLKYPWFSNRR